MNVKNSSKKSKTKWAKLSKLKDTEIDTTDAPALDKSFFKNAVLKMPRVSEENQGNTQDVYAFQGCIGNRNSGTDRYFYGPEFEAKLTDK